MALWLGLLTAEVRAQAPVITTVSAPRQVVTLGQNLMLTVNATSNSTPSYQWWRNGKPVAGATGASYTITSAVPTRDNGWYRAVVTNAGGATTSAVVFVNVAVASSHILAVGAKRGVEESAPLGLGSISAVTAGDQYSLALKGDGTLAAWGSASGGPRILPVVSEVVAVAAGGTHALALKSDGTVVAWGNDSWGQGRVPAGLNGVVAVAAGYLHSLALKSDGTVVAWGYNDRNQNDIPAATRDVVKIAAGYSHNVLLKRDGSVIVVGRNTSATEAPIPPEATDLEAIAGGIYHTMALKGDGTFVSWGFASDGLTKLPAGVGPLTAVAAGFFSMGMKGDGSVVVWGPVYTPASINGAVAIAQGYSHGLVLRNAAGDSAPVIVTQPLGRAFNLGESATFSVTAGAGNAPLSYQWRKNGAAITDATGSSYSVDEIRTDSAGTYDVVVTNYLGTVTSAGAVATVNPSPIVSAGLTGRYTVGLGQSLTLTLAPTVAAGATVQWRRNGFPIPGATGRSLAIADAGRTSAGYYQAVYSENLRTVTSGAIFVVVTPATSQLAGWGNSETLGTPPTSAARLVAIASRTFSIGLLSDGTVASWGIRPSMPFPSPTNVVAVAGGSFFSLFLRADGTLRQTVDTTLGVVLPPEGLSGVVAIAAGSSHNLAVRNDGTVVAWGSSGGGGTQVPAGLSGVAAVAAGDGFSLALKSDGTVVGWGRNDWGQSTAPAGLTNVVAISAGSAFALALKADGTVVAWGYNSGGQTLVPTGLSNVIAISAGSDHGLALRADGTVAAWGAANGSYVEVPAKLGSVFALAAGSSISQALRDTSGDLLPTLTGSPQSVSALTGQSVSFSVSATGGSAFLTYQWRKGGVALAGATAASLLLPGVTVASAGAYDVVVKSSAGSVTSGPATLTVGSAPAVTVLPAGRQSLSPGQSVDLVGTSAMTGAVSYQWRRNGRPLAGATSARLTLSRVAWSDAGVYQLVATNAVGAAQSKAVFVNVTQATQLLSWGNNSLGQTTIPAGLTGVVALAAGSRHSVALKSDGTIAAWGLNGNGQTNIPAGLSDVVAIAAGGVNTMALRADGTVVAWGSLNFTPAGLDNVVAISAGLQSAMALKGDGTVVVWDANGVSRLTPSNATDVIAISAGYYHYLALKADGTVLAWGSDIFSETRVPAAANGAVDLVAGETRSFAIKADGTLIGWGNLGPLVPTEPIKVRKVASSGVGTITVLPDERLALFGGTAFSEIALFPTEFSSLLVLTAGGNHALTLRDPSADTAPRITVPPTAVVSGTTTVLQVTAAANPAPSYQWRFNGAVISGATSATYTPASAQVASGGSFDVVVTNYLGSVTSAAVTLAAPGRLINLSVLAGLTAPGDSFTMGYVVGGAGTGGAKPLVIRAAGPSLRAVGVSDPLADPKLVLFANGVKSDGNDDWGGTAALASGFTAVGAFPYIAGNSKDAAVATNVFTRDNSVEVSAGGDGKGLGLVLAEIYDATGSAAFSATTPRLINVSVRKHLGDLLTVGFVLGGGASKKVLIRAVGPTLAAFGVPDTVADSQLALFNVRAEKIGENNDWGGTAELTAASTAVGAFPLAATSKDAVLLTTLAPGNYTVQVKGVGGTTGVALVEVYEVP